MQYQSLLLVAEVVQLEIYIIVVMMGVLVVDPLQIPAQLELELLIKVIQEDLLTTVGTAAAAARRGGAGRSRCSRAP